MTERENWAKTDGKWGVGEELWGERLGDEWAQEVEARLLDGDAESAEKLVRGRMGDGAPSVRARALLASALLEQGRLIEARREVEHALDDARAAGMESLDAARARVVLARVEREEGLAPQALEDVRAARGVIVRELGAESAEAVWATSNVARCLWAVGELASAHAEAADAAARGARVFGEESLALAILELHLAEVEHAMGTSGACERATKAREAIVASVTRAGRSAEEAATHPRVLEASLACARVCDTDGAQTWAFLEADLPRTLRDLPRLTEFEKRRRLRWREECVGRLVAMAMRRAHAEDPGESADRAMDAVLSHKNLRTDAERSELTQLRRVIDGQRGGGGDAEATLARIVVLRREYAAITLRMWGEEDGAARDALDVRRRGVQAELGGLAVSLRSLATEHGGGAVLQGVRSDDVRRALRRGEGVVEFVRYTPEAEVHPTASAQANQEKNAAPEAWYGALIVRGDGAARCEAVPLARAAEVDALVVRYRKVMEMERGVRDAEAESKVARVLAQLYALVWKPLEVHVRGATRVYVAPDGLLHQVPFDALAREVPAGERQSGAGAWRYLIEDVPELLYVSSARDVVGCAARAADTRKPGDGASANAQPAAQKAGDVLLIADPAFGDASVGVLPRGSVPMHWQAVPQTGEFARSVQSGLRALRVESTLVQGEDAGEDVLLRVRNPLALIVATHGWQRGVMSDDDPLLSSMLLLRGCNSGAANGGAGAASQDAPGGAIDDGRLTAYELIGAADLRATQLVVLVACRSGLGEASDEGGSEGLRRALSICGATCVVSTMFDVPVQASIEQMLDFQKRWLGMGGDAGMDVKQGRYDAFRAAQREALARARREQGSGHPFWWAGFTYWGDAGDVGQAE